MLEADPALKRPPTCHHMYIRPSRLDSLTRVSSWPQMPSNERQPGGLSADNMTRNTSMLVALALLLSGLSLDAEARRAKAAAPAQTAIDWKGVEADAIKSLQA